MPIHDWSSVNACYFHSFSLSWITAISSSLKKGVLPSSHYSLIENHRDGRIRHFVELPETESARKEPIDQRGCCFLDEKPPLTSYHDVSSHPEYAEKVITIRQCQFHNVVSAIRFVTPQTKRSRYRINQFVAWAVEVIRDGVSLMVIDLFRSGSHDPNGIHKAIWDEFVDNGFVLPTSSSLTFASYLAEPMPEAFVEISSFGSPLPAMPLFLNSGSYVMVPLAGTYERTFENEPEQIRLQFTETGN